MSLWFFLNVNDQRIGMCEIRRQEHLDLSDRDAIADVVSTYTVKVDDLPSVEVKHRYGDGAWPLVRRAINAAFPVFDPAEVARIEAEMNDPEAWGEPCDEPPPRRDTRIDRAALVQVALGCGIDRSQAEQVADAMHALGWRR